MHSDWVLALTIEIDRHRPGFCGEFFRLSDERRQVIAAYLASKPPAASDIQMVGEFLQTADHRTILASGFGKIPVGMRGALRRAGPIAHEQRFYSILYRLLSKPRHREIAKCLARLPSLDLNRLRIANMLPEILCRANVVASLDGISDASDVLTGFRLLTSRGVDDEALATAIRRVQSESDFAKLWQKWVLKAKCAPHPVPTTDWYRPITTGAELHRAALLYRNCARRYTADILDSEAGHAFAEVRIEGRGAIVHLHRVRGEWQLDGIYGPRNSRVGEELRARSHQHLRAHGVTIDRYARKASEWDALRRLVSVPYFEFDVDLTM